MDMLEEINRVLTDRVSTWLFCPTDVAVENLNREGIYQNGNNQLVENVGDVMYDAVQYYKEIAIPTKATISALNRVSSGYYLATVHRAENTDNLLRLSQIINALDVISTKKNVLLPIHPRTKKILETNSMMPSNIKIIDPVGYFDMIALLSHCDAVFTDSGGVQKEAYFLKNVVLR